MKKFLDDEEITKNKKKSKNNPHYVKNSPVVIDISQKEENQKILQQTKIDYRNILGYIAKKNDKLIYVKYNKETGEYIEYSMNNSEPVIITYCIKTMKEYNGDKAIFYYDELL